MKTRQWRLCLAVVSMLAACSEPDSTVTRSTGDALFEVTLEAAKNHLKPGEALPVLVTVERLGGPPAITTRDTIEFVANQGSVSASRLVFTFAGRDDSLYAEATSLHTDWITFTLTSRPDAGSQAELHALFHDLNTTLKIRIVEE